MPWLLFQTPKELKNLIAQLETKVNNNELVNVYKHRQTRVVVTAQADDIIVHRRETDKRFEKVMPQLSQIIAMSQNVIRDLQDDVGSENSKKAQVKYSNEYFTRSCCVDAFCVL